MTDQIDISPQQPPVPPPGATANRQGIMPGGLPPEQAPVEQTILQGVNMIVTTDTQNQRRLFFIDTPTKQIVIPMSFDTAKFIGRALMAPAIEVPMPGQDGTGAM